MSKEPEYTHTVKPLGGKGAAEKVTADTLESMQKRYGKGNLEVTPIEAVEKPAPLAKAPKPEESKKSE